MYDILLKSFQRKRNICILRKLFVSWKDYVNNKHVAKQNSSSTLNSLVVYNFIIINIIMCFLIFRYLVRKLQAF